MAHNTIVTSDNLSVGHTTGILDQDSSQSDMPFSEASTELIAQTVEDKSSQATTYMKMKTMHMDDGSIGYMYEM
mgnify:CR=1 FL=1